MIIEFFKKRQKSLARGFGVSALLLLTALIIVSNIEWLTLVSLIVLLSPPGFLFILLATLLLGSAIGSLLWVGAEYAIERVQRWHEHRRQTRLTGEEDGYSAWAGAGVEETSFLHESNTQNQDIVWVSDGDIKNDMLLSPEDDLAEFSRKADGLFNALNNFISSQEDISHLSESLDEFKKIYYELAKKYHPDKGCESKSTLFQQLNEAYRKVKMAVDRKLEHLNQKSWTELIDEENQLLKDFLSMLKNHQASLNKAEEELNAIGLLIEGLDVGITRNVEGTRNLDKKIARLDEGIARNAEGIEHNAELLKRNDATSARVKEQQEFLVRVVTRLHQETTITAQEEISSNDDKNKVIPSFFS